jgi:hypothetical protein
LCVSLLRTVTVAELKLLLTATVGDKKCFICSVRPILPMPFRHDSAGYLWGY